jgi:hypothetical protein
MPQEVRHGSGVEASRGSGQQDGAGVQLASRTRPPFALASSTHLFPVRTETTAGMTSHGGDDVKPLQESNPFIRPPCDAVKSFVPLHSSPPAMVTCNTATPLCERAQGPNAPTVRRFVRLAHHDGSEGLSSRQTGAITPRSRARPLRCRSPLFRPHLSRQHLARNSGDQWPYSLWLALGLDRRTLARWGTRIPQWGGVAPFETRTQDHGSTCLSFGTRFALVPVEAALGRPRA